jgi:tetratricopeptide (TPR) repeat protein
LTGTAPSSFSLTPSSCLHTPSLIMPPSVKRSLKGPWQGSLTSGKRTLTIEGVVSGPASPGPGIEAARRTPVSRKSIKRGKGHLTLAAFLVGLSALAPCHLFPQAREISAKILADEECRQDPDWQIKIEACLSEASSAFERLFGIRVVPRKYEPWVSDDAAGSLATLVEELDAHADKENADVLLAFTAQENLDKGHVGYSLFLEGIILSRYGQDLRALTRILKHELGHLFGGVHAADPGSVMDSFLQGDAFDRLNREGMALWRERLFNTVEFPLSKNMLAAAVAHYEKVCRSIQTSLAGEASAKDIPPAIGNVFAEPQIRGVLVEGGGRDSFYLDDAFVLLAQLYLEAREYDKAIQACRAALSFNPGNLETQSILGVAFRRKGLIDQAIEKYGAILEVRPRQPKVLYNLGIAYAKKADLGAAQSAYRKAIEFKPNFAEAHNNLGETYLRQGRMAEAEAEFLTAVSILPEFPLARANLAEIYYQKKDYDRSQAEAEKAMAMNPELPDPYNILGNILHQRGQTEEAAREYRQALALDAGYEKAYFNLGICFFERNQIREAKDLFVKALEINKNFAEARASLGYCLLRENKTDEAIAEIKLGQSLGLDSAASHINLCFAYLQKGMTDQAVWEAEKAVALDPGQAAAFNNLGIAYTKRGRIQKAAGQFQRALEIDPDNRDALFNLGCLYFQAGKLDRALDLYLAAARVDRNNGLIFNNIAVVYFRTGAYVLARSYARKAQESGFEVDPQFLSELEGRIKIKKE